MVKVMDKLEVIGNWTDHPFKIGEIVTVYRVYSNDKYDVYNSQGVAATLELRELIKQTNTTMKLMKDAVRDTANKLCKAQNTVTTLELKVELRKTHPYFHWIQNSRNGLIGVSEFMEELHQDGEFTFTDNGQYRVYSAVTKVKSAPKKAVVVPITSVAIPMAKAVPNTKGKSISRQKALDLMANNKGHFFTAEFIKQDGAERTINCQYMKGQNPTLNGYVMVKEAGKMKQGVNAIRQINLQTLLRIRIAGQDYRVK